MRMLGFNILVKEDLSDNISEGGIILTDTESELPRRGTVVEVGVGVQKHGTTKVGDYVRFPKYIGMSIELEGVEYLIMDEGQVLVNEGAVK